MRGILYALAALLGSGCATFGTYTGARPIDPGSFQLGIEPGMWRVVGGGAAPSADLTARYGFGRRLDLGVRAGTSGFGVTGKLALTDPRAHPWIVSVAPSASTVPWGRRPLHVQVPVLVGFGLGPHELTVAPKLQAWSTGRLPPWRRGRSTVIAAGLSVGASVRIARGIRIVPELTVAQPILGAMEARAPFTDLELRPSRPLYQFSLGVLLGGERHWWRRQYYVPYPYSGGYRYWP